MRRAAFVAAILVLVGSSARAATLEVEVEGAEAGGTVYVALCREGLSEEECGSGREVPARGGALRAVFEGVAAGRYAVAAFEDLDGNGRLDRTRLGLPTEPYGFSGSVGARGRPDFARAAFSLREPGTALRIRLARALPRR